MAQFSKNYTVELFTPQFFFYVFALGGSPTPHPISSRPYFVCKFSRHGSSSPVDGSSSPVNGSSSPVTWVQFTCQWVQFTCQHGSSSPVHGSSSPVNHGSSSRVPWVQFTCQKFVNSVADLGSGIQDLVPF